MIQLLFKGLIWRTQKVHSTQGSETQYVVDTCAHEQLWQPLSEPDNCFKPLFSSTFTASLQQEHPKDGLNATICSSHPCCRCLGWAQLQVYVK